MTYVPSADRTAAKKMIARIQEETGVTATVRFTNPVLGMTIHNFTVPAQTTDEQMGEIDAILQDTYRPLFNLDRR